jgi:hypothetical protein
MLNAVRGHRARSIALGLGLLTPLLVMVIVWRNPANDAFQPSEKGPVSAKNPQETYEDSLQHPLDGGEEVTLGEAERKAKYKIPLPSDSEANRSNLDKVFASEGHDVALRFSSDVLLILEPAQFTDARAEFESLVSSGALPNGRVEDVRGHPALVVDPGTDKLGTNPGSVQFLWNGISITVYAADFSGERIKDIAASIGYEN